MYKAEQKEISAEDSIILVWGISDDNGFILDFTTDKNIAEEFADILNKNDVERQHIAEIIEDYYYSG